MAKTIFLLTEDQANEFGKNKTVYAIVNYLGETAKGVPYFIIEKSLKDLIDKINSFMQKLNLKDKYYYEDFNEKDIEDEHFISDDFVFATTHENVFRKDLKDAEKNLGKKAKKF